MRLMLAAALLACATTPALGQDDGLEDDPDRDHVGYRWFEAGLGVQRLSDPAGPDQRADLALRLATNVDVAPHFYLHGSFITASYEPSSVHLLSGGIGAKAPLVGALHGDLELAFESLDGQDVTQNGYGAQAGLRWLVPAFEAGLSVSQSRLKAAEGGPYSGAVDRYRGLKFFVVVPFSQMLSLTLRAERLTGTGGDVNEDREFDTVVVGVRLRP